MGGGWICVALWLGFNVAFGAVRLFVTRQRKVSSEPNLRWSASNGIGNYLVVREEP
ncbi:MAG: hypothetical protein QOJ42_2825 [Acidobacteriaceae bacterium]|jgi:hypothetical protein|nr:hypothetical protein [Acidobacteriaceae bacterium]